MVESAHEFGQRAEDVVEAPAYVVIERAEVTDRLGCFESGECFSRGPEGAVVPSPSRPRAGASALSDVEDHAHAGPAQLPCEVTIEASDLICQQTNIANHLKSNGINA